MKKYVAYNIVNGLKFYLSQAGEWELNSKKFRVFLENEIGLFFNKNLKKYELKTNHSQLLVEEYYETSS